VSHRKYDRLQYRQRWHTVYGDPRASYLLIDDGQPFIRRVGYDVEKEAARRDLVFLVTKVTRGPR
jgi:predicted cupin superfamily sugar epimerase